MPERVEVRTTRVDSVVTGAASDFLHPKLDPTFALAAVGGYGRSELFLHSDIDLLLLFASEEDIARAKAAIEEFLRSLWDSGLRVSHSVRTTTECCRLHEQNTELHISLLDLRFLCGNHGLFDILTQRLQDFYHRHGPPLIAQLIELARRRHAKFNNTVYHLEPNVKEAPGGIRDVHLLRWLSQLAPHNDSIREFSCDVADAQQFLYSVRGFLHSEAGRDSNLLTFELQAEAARALLWGQTSLSQMAPVPSARNSTRGQSGPSPSSHPAIDPAEWMRLYFRHARRLFQSTLRAIECADQDTSLLRQFRDWRSRLSTREFTISRERVLLRNATETLRSANSVLSLFAFAARHGLQLSWDTQRRIRGTVSLLETSFVENPPPPAAWRTLFSQPHTALALREMQETGLLAAAIPEWHAIDSLVVPDFYHRYTVDEHTLTAIDALDQLMVNQPGVPPRFRELLLEEDDPSALRLALLLHDLGKGTRPGNHVEGSLEAARLVLRRMGLPTATQDRVLFLIEHHLDLSLIMNGRDLEDPATARFLTSWIGTEDQLRSLTLLTYADVSAVNPTAMTGWRLEQLWRVYSTGLERLTRELANDRVLPNTVSPELASFVQGLPTRYLRTHAQEEIEQHLELYRRAQRDGLALDIAHSGGAYLLTVMAQDRPGLFGSLCGALASFGMNIVKAEAASNDAGYILDLIRFTDPMRTLELNPSEIERVQQTIGNVIRGSVEVSDLLKRRRAMPRPSHAAKIAPVVRFDNQASDTSTLIDFIGEDRPGLLYDLATALTRAGCNIDVLMIDTQAHKAIDVFYVTRNGAKLDPALEPRLRDDLLRLASH